MRDALSTISTSFNSRNLRLTRFADPRKKEDKRKEQFQAGLSTVPCKNALMRWHKVLEEEFGLKAEDILYGKLNSRLALHLSGGVMENANILLDRYGIPYIPGSGVKGCARHAALADLYERAHLQTPPTNEQLAIELSTIALIFGWTEADWNIHSEKSDFVWAVGKNKAVSISPIVFEKLNGQPFSAKSTFGDHEGSVTFLHAYPVAEGYPQNGSDLELDVLTPHHTKYYNGEREVALDDENPVPVYFPTVAAGVEFSFPIYGKDQALVERAKVYLKRGLEIFGIGGKTAAGYGWFGFDTALGGTVDQVALQPAKQQPPDYNEKTYQNKLLQPARNPALFAHVEREMKTLSEPRNRGWLERFIKETSGKEFAKIREKPWYPKL